jgi:outer membrane protein TolC
MFLKVNYKLPASVYQQILLIIFIFLSHKIEASNIDNNLLQQNSDYLNQKMVIESALKHYPKILAYYEKINLANSNLLSQMGVFDIRIRQEYSDKTRGYYDGKYYDLLLEKQNELFNNKIYGGYRRSNGDFPSYEANKYTSQEGKFIAGGKVSLLQNNTIDKNRLAIKLSNLDISLSKLQIDNIKNILIRDAKKAYLEWFFAREKYFQYQNLYQLAITRNNALEIRYKKGDIAKITLIEGQRNLLQRQNELSFAKIDFENSAIYLSLFLRDDNGKSIIVDESRLANHHHYFDVKNIAFKNHQLNQDLDSAYNNNPELHILDLQVKKEQENLRYYNNLLMPKLDLQFELSRNISQNSNNYARIKDQDENMVKLNFEMPFRQREARGNIDGSLAKIKSLQYERQLLKDKISNEIKQIFTNLTNFYNIANNIESELKLTKSLVKAEQERFNQGASSLFLLNQREQELLKIQIDQIHLIKNFYKTVADYEMLTFNQMN